MSSSRPAQRRGVLSAIPLVFLLSSWHLFHHTATAFANSNDAASVPAAANSNSASSQQSPSLLADKKVCISGGGPCGLFLAALLIQNDPTVQITILEKSERGGGSINAFGIGLGARLLHSLDAVPGLRQKVESVGAKTNFGSKIISRTDLSEQMTRFVENMDRERRQCQIRFGEGCADIDLEGKEVTTTAGRKIQYDLLIGADGINSSVRHMLVEKKGLKVEHYLEPSLWKALRLPPQSDFDAGSFKALRHPVLRGGRLLPRYPEGHIILAFWSREDGSTNPGNLDTSEELKAMFTDALQDDPPKQSARKNRKLLGLENDGDIAGKKRDIVFDDEAVDIFLKTRPGRSHYMKVDRFHDDSVALVGDAAHGMNSMLGQGCAAGLKYTQVLVEELGSDSKHLNEALQSYSKRAVRGAHAITDLNRVGVTVLKAGPILKALMFPFVMLQKILGRTIFEQIGKVDIPYEQILRENWLLIPFARLRWRLERVPFPTKPTRSA
mmetsp:Transcript_17678/g.31957  ORF Transcript_17678/g.31957 Transcript_17678/m.31957 type:complete len:497 (+) Transcript_17678:45-1535(+)